MTHNFSHRARGYCLVFARETAEFECSIEDNRLVVTPKPEYKGPKSFLCWKTSVSVVNEFENQKDILAPLRDGGLEYLITELPSDQGGHIVVVVTVNNSWAEDWAEIRDFQLEIEPKEAIKYGRQNEGFALSHRTYVPILDAEGQFRSFLFLSIFMYYLPESVPCKKKKKNDFHDGAEHIYNMLSLELWNGIHVAYESANVPRAVFKQDSHGCVLNNRLFLRILYQIMTEPAKLGGCGFNVDRYVNLPNHPLKQIFALNCGHQPIAHTCDVLRPSRQLWMDKINDLRNYFGEHIAFYFAFLSFYTKWLLYILPFSIAVSIYQFKSEEIIPNGSEFLIFVFFVWATLMSEIWYQREHELRFKWGLVFLFFFLLKKKKKTPKKILFLNKKKKKKFDKKILLLGRTEISRINGDVIEVYENAFSRFMKIMFSMSGIFTSIGAVVASVYGMWSLKQLISNSVRGDTAQNGFSVGVGIINSLQIQFFNYVYVYFANYVNEWEGHRLQEEWYNHLVVKRIFFFIVNSFNSLIYLLYISPEFDTNDAKLKAVRTQLLTLFFTAIITQNTME
ncbi:hypothetical protein RFI_21210, partial [Reticulomyxa filosa]